MNRGSNQNRMWIIADELGEIYEKGKKNDNATSSFRELYRQGRFNNLGFIGNTQSLEKLEPDMYKNANYVMSCFLKDAKERKKFADYGVDKTVYEQIRQLGVLQAMVFKNPKDVFIIYDRWGRRRVERDRCWFRGKIIPPVNHHMSPGDK